MNFEEEMKRLDEITAEMGKSDIALEKSLALYEEAVKRIRTCKDYLAKAKITVERLSLNNDG